MREGKWGNPTRDLLCCSWALNTFSLWFVLLWGVLNGVKDVFFCFDFFQLVSHCLGGCCFFCFVVILV